jgi:hypothetical protein
MRTPDMEWCSANSRTCANLPLIMMPTSLQWRAGFWTMFVALLLGNSLGNRHTHWPGRYNRCLGSKGLSFSSFGLAQGLVDPGQCRYNFMSTHNPTVKLDSESRIRR